MKDIFIVECPITERIVALSSSPYGKYANQLKNNWQFNHWIRMLSKRNLKPVVKILEKVSEKDFSLIYEMYLGLFKSWNIELLNFDYPIPISPLKSFIEKPYALNKYTLTDLGYIHEKLRDIYSHYKKITFLNNEHQLVFELITFCGIHVQYGEDWKELLNKTYNELDRRTRHDDELPKYLFESIEHLGRIRMLKNQKKSFEEISKYDLPQILNCLNHLFAEQQAYITLNEAVWPHLHAFLGYVQNKSEYNRKYQAIDLFNQFENGKSSKITLDEFNKMYTEIVEF